MSTTLTIRNLDPAVKQKLRLRAAQHQTSMEADARGILAKGLNLEPNDEAEKQIAQVERTKRIESCVGIWKDRYAGKSTNEIMKELRGDD